MIRPLRRTHYRNLWLVAALVVTELLALSIAAATNPFPATRFSLVVALLVLTSGVLPALLLPNTQSLLAACFATVLASVIVLPFDPALQPPPSIWLNTSLHTDALMMRLLNAALLGPISVHFVLWA